MAKVVYNACHGGFNLSEAAVQRYAEIKGIPLWIEAGSEAMRRMGVVTYYTVPEGERIEMLENWCSHPAEVLTAHSAKYKSQRLDARAIPRHDSALVQVVEELGDKASGPFADLKIAVVPDGGRYRIEEYDGRESIEQPDDIEWNVAS